MDTQLFDSAQYKRSRISYIIQCALEYFIAIMVADAFLAKLLTAIGIKDSLIGIIASFISFAFLFQLLSIGLVSKIKNVKKTILIFDTVSQLLFMSIYFIPMLDMPAGLKAVIAMSAIMAAYIFKYLISAIFFKWANSFVLPGKRGMFSAVKEIVSLVSGMAFSLFIGHVIDKYEAIGDLNGGFLFIAFSMLLINVMNFISILLIKNEKVEHDVQRKKFSDIINNTVMNPNFRSAIILTALWDVARYMSVGFMGTFKTKDLMLSVWTVQIINMIASGVRVVMSVPIGKYSDKKSYAKGFELGMIIAGAGYIAAMFATKERWWLVAVHTVLFTTAFAGTNSNAFNITYSYVKNEYISQALAVRSCIGGVLGFISSLIGSVILELIQKNGNSVFGIHVYGQQVLSLISLILVIITFFYGKLVVEKKKVMRQ